nr:IS30 family transposase [Fluviibacter phosphoraccumulans]
MSSALWPSSYCNLEVEICLPKRVKSTELDSTGYFADPFASWQRGSNENFNGLLRQYIPKKRPLSTVTDEELKMIEDKLNFRPRKRLGFKTPHQVFHESLNRVALRP